jgi:hypothetical protein
VVSESPRRGGPLLEQLKMVVEGGSAGDGWNNLVQASGQWKGDQEVDSASLPGYRLQKKIDHDNPPDWLEPLIRTIEARVRQAEGPGNLQAIYLLATIDANTQVIHIDQLLELERKGQTAISTEQVPTGVLVALQPMVTPMV